MSVNGDFDESNGALTDQTAGTDDELYRVSAGDIRNKDWVGGGLIGQLNQAGFGYGKERPVKN